MTPSNLFYSFTPSNLARKSTCTESANLGTQLVPSFWCVGPVWKEREVQSFSLILYLYRALKYEGTEAKGWQARQKVGFIDRTAFVPVTTIGMCADGEFPLAQHTCLGIRRTPLLL